jgi:hypothetical protein
VHSALSIGHLDYDLSLQCSTSYELTVYTNADWAGYPDTCWSTTGYAVFLSVNLVSWSSKRQNTLSHSSVEAEYWIMTNGMTEAYWLRQLLHELYAPLMKSTLVYCDNISAVYLSTNLIHHQRMKYVEIDLHLVRGRVTIGDIRVLHVPMTSQFTDIFTKCVSTSLFLEFQSSLNIHSG